MSLGVLLAFLVLVLAIGGAALGVLSVAVGGMIGALALAMLVASWPTVWRWPR